VNSSGAFQQRKNPSLINSTGKLQLHW